jgi:hypothetical protein
LTAFLGLSEICSNSRVASSRSSYVTGGSFSKL